MKLPKEFVDAQAPTIASFGSALLKTSTKYSLREARLAALARLSEIVRPDQDECLATHATGEDIEDRLRDLEDSQLWKIWDPVSTI